MKLLLSLMLVYGVLFSAPVVLDFEGLQQRESVDQYYNGGNGGAGSGPGPSYGIEFSATSLVLTSGSYANEPSPTSILFFTSGGAATMNIPAGFDTGFSFYYSAFADGNVVVYDGPNATGNILATIPLPTNTSVTADTWQDIGVTFSGTAMSVDFAGGAGTIGFDDITIGSATPGAPVDDDDDDDGSDSATEGQAPGVGGSATGDGNGDGEPDSEQSSVTSGTFTADSGTEYFTLGASVGGSDIGVKNSNVGHVGTPTNSLPDGVTMPFGQFGFTVTGIAAGATVSLELFVPYDSSIDGYYKWNNDTAQWDALTGVVVTQFQSDNKTKIAFSLVEGGPYDDNGATAGLVDDGGPVIRATAAPVAVPLFGPFGYLLMAGLFGFFGVRRLKK